MTTRDYLISILSQLNIFPDSNNCVIPYLKSKPEELQDIRYIYFTYIGEGFLISLVHNNKNYVLIIIKNNDRQIYSNTNLKELLKNLTKTERKNILGISKIKTKTTIKIIEPEQELINIFHPIDYINMNCTELINKLNNLEHIFDISGLLFITDEVIQTLAPNETINIVILNNNIKIRSISNLIALFPNVKEIYINNMKHLTDNMICINNAWLDVCSISNCSVTMRVMLNLLNVSHIILNSINLECQVSMTTPLIILDEWQNLWQGRNNCKHLAIISNNLTFDCMKLIIEYTPELLEFRILDIILRNLRDGAVKTGYEKESIIFTSDKNSLTLHRDLKWQNLLADNCYYNNYNDCRKDNIE